MNKAKFLCLSKTGETTFTVHLEPLAEAVSPACKVCGKRTHEDFCQGADPVAVRQGGLGKLHDITAMDEGDTSFFKDLPGGTISLFPLTPEAAAQFEVGKVTIVSFQLEDIPALPAAQQ